MRVFLDTNVLVSAFTTRGLGADVFRLVLAEHELIVGRIVLEELRGVLREKIGLPESAVREALTTGSRSYGFSIHGASGKNFAETLVSQAGLA